METRNENSNVVESIRRKLDSSGCKISKYICIYRVPPKLRQVNEEAYTPQVVSIGPFHHGKQHLAEMEKHKLDYLEKFLERGAGGKGLEDFASHIQKEEATIRRCYADALEDLSSDQFCEIILVDSIFILELFKRIKESARAFDFIVGRAWPRYQIQEDLILLENQIPLFLLIQLYELAFSAPEQEFLGLATNYFSNIAKITQPLPGDTQHFTDLLRRSLLPDSTSRLESVEDNSTLWYSATKLREAGVKFVVGRSDCLLDIEFKNGKLAIPQLEFNDQTDCIYRNVMALEQCHYPYETTLCHYVQVLVYLINTAKDVELLVENKILDNKLGAHQSAADVINKLCLHIGLGGGCTYGKLIMDLNAYYQAPYNTWKANLKHEYFSTPWRIASAVAAFTLLAFAFIQTLVTVLQFATKR